VHGCLLWYWRVAKYHGKHALTLGGTGMRFGMHLFLACARSQTPTQRYAEAIEQAVRAEALGFESVWPVEHHFTSVASVLSCPSMLLAAIAARTERLRLGTAILQLPLAHPLRIAEEIASLDVLSAGRVELGIGRGGNPVHFAGFGVPLAESRARFEESYRFIRSAFAGEQFSFQGQYHSAPKLALVPQPHQPGGPRFHVAANSGETAFWAGREGLSMLLASNVHPLPAMPKLLDAYRAGREQRGHAAAKPDDISLLMPVFVGKDGARVREIMAPSIRHQVELTEMLLQAAMRSRAPSQFDGLTKLLAHLKSLDFDSVDQTMGLLGDVAHCRERLHEIVERLRPGRIIAWFDFGGCVPHAQVLESMELFSEAILPEWRAHSA